MSKFGELLKDPVKKLLDAIAWRCCVASRKRYLLRSFQNGAELLESYLQKSTNVTQAIRRDGTVVKHPPDRGGFVQMLLEVWYEKVYISRFFHPKPGDVIIDAGANIGMFSLQMSELEPTCTVFAFEPFEENFRYLCENLRAASANNVQCIRGALSGESGQSMMVDIGSRSQDHRLSNTLTKDFLSPTPLDLVSTYSLEDIFQKVGANRIALFKCDIEGSEYSLFKNASSDCLERIDNFAIEWHEHLQTGTLELIRDRLKSTHDLRVSSDDGQGRYGMLYAKRKP